MSSPSTKILDVLKQPETQLNKLIEQARAIELLNKRFASLLPSEFASHCRIGHFEAGVLTLFTDNAAWATRLRYAVPTLLSNLRQEPSWAGLCSIQIKVQTYQAPPDLTPNAVLMSDPIHPTERNAKQLLALADALKGVEGMEKVVQSLENLAKHHK
jgi:hypothetical protein